MWTEAQSASGYWVYGSWGEHALESVLCLLDLEFGPWLLEDAVLD